MRGLMASIAAVGLFALLAPHSRAQAVAFQPVVSSFPNGATLSATPVVSADRRYVRLTVNPVFNSLIGFDAFSVPAAVSGGGVNGGLPGILGGGGGGGLGGGGRAGMNGLIAPAPLLVPGVPPEPAPEGAAAMARKALAARAAAPGPGATAEKAKRPPSIEIRVEKPDAKRRPKPKSTIRP
jgi:hypothetical protein